MLAVLAAMFTISQLQWHVDLRLFVCHGQSASQYAVQRAHHRSATRALAAVACLAWGSSAFFKPIILCNKVSGQSRMSTLPGLVLSPFQRLTRRP